MDPARNADMAASILADDLHAYGGDVRAALSAYNAGSPIARGTTTRWADGATLGYADSVLRHYDALGSPESASANGRPPSVTGIVETAMAARYSGAAGIGRPTDIAPGIAAGLAPFGSMGTQAAPFSASVPWLELNRSGAAESDAADQAIADLVDSGDVFGNGADDDS
ncbi:MAG: hypothetical protein NVS4B5_15010 [Vulcanimicrobiaceae bacterium]